MSGDRTGRTPEPVDGARDVDGTDPGAELADQVARLADRLRSLSDVRLGAVLPGGGSRADAAHRLAQHLADVAADLAGEPRRVLPRLDDLVVGDQVAVTGNDLVSVLRHAASGDGARWRSTADSAVTAVNGLRDLV